MRVEPLAKLDFTMYDPGTLTTGIILGLIILMIITGVSVLIVVCTTGGRIQAKVISEAEV